MPQQSPMTSVQRDNDKARMTNDKGMPNFKARKQAPAPDWPIQSSRIRISFVIRISVRTSERRPLDRTLHALLGVSLAPRLQPGGKMGADRGEPFQRFAS